MVDVETEITIARERAEVAAFAADPDNATSWYENIEQVEWRSPEPLAVGTQLAFVARFLGRRLAYTYEVKEHVPGDRFVMSTADGPFPMETTYTWHDEPGGGTCMTLRNRGVPSGFSRLAAPFMAWAVRRANRKDLRRLKAILEGRSESRDSDLFGPTRSRRSGLRREIGGRGLIVERARRSLHTEIPSGRELSIS